MNKKQYSVYEFPSYTNAGTLICVKKTLNGAKKAAVKLASLDSKVEIYHDKSLVGRLSFVIEDNELIKNWEL